MSSASTDNFIVAAACGHHGPARFKQLPFPTKSGGEAEAASKEALHVAVVFFKATGGANMATGAGVAAMVILLGVWLVFPVCYARSLK